MNLQQLLLAEVPSEEAVAVLFGNNLLLGALSQLKGAIVLLLLIIRRVHRVVAAIILLRRHLEHRLLLLLLLLLLGVELGEVLPRGGGKGADLLEDVHPLRATKNS